MDFEFSGNFIFSGVNVWGGAGEEVVFRQNNIVDAFISLSLGGYAIATENYFGTTDGTVIGHKIHDNNDDLNLKDEIEFWPVLTESPPQIPLVSFTSAELPSELTHGELQGRASVSLTGNGNDNTLLGNGGANRLEGRAGADQLDGRRGFDTASYSLAPGGILLDLTRPGRNTGDAHGDTFRRVEAFAGSTHKDALLGSPERDVLAGDAGNDRIAGRGGDDLLRGDDGDDELQGVAGADALWGGLGRDQLFGGPGPDRFAFAAAADSSQGSGVDVIRDFSQSADPAERDIVDLRGVDAAPGTDGNQRFHFLGTKEFTGGDPDGDGNLRGELRSFARSGTTMIEADVNGDKSARPRH